MKPEQIQSMISYYETDKIKNLEESIAFYKECGAHKDLTEMYNDLAGLKNTVANYRKLLENGPQKKEGIKVRVSAYNGNVIVDTVDADVFDSDFVPAGEGRIGCSLNNNARLGISLEALEIIKTYKRVGDVIGDLMGDKDSFTWIGPVRQILRPESVVCRTFDIPKEYVIIDNSVPEELCELLDGKSEAAIKMNSIEYKDFKQELWIELSVSGSWKPTAADPSKSEYVYNDYFTLQNSEGARFVGGNIYDKSVSVLNAPEGLVKIKNESIEVNMSPEIKSEILGMCLNMFKKNPGDDRWNIKVDVKDIMSYINPLFDLGFDNNVMNPQPGYWRMSIKATPEVMLEKLKSFKREM